MNAQKQVTGKAYSHKQIIRMAYSYLPVFSIILLICSAFDKLRFFLYITVVGATYGYILQQMKKKHSHIEFKSDDITIDQTTYNFRDIESFYLSLPLNELLMLRIRTNENRDVAIYIDKNLKKTIENFFNNHSISSNKTDYDSYLQYGHLLLAFTSLLICFLALIVYNFVYYKILN